MTQTSEYNKSLNCNTINYLYKSIDLISKYKTTNFKKIKSSSSELDDQKSYLNDMAKEHVYKYFNQNGRLFKCLEDIHVKKEYLDDLVKLSCEALDVEIIADNMDEANEMFLGHLLWLWDYYALSDDINLGNNAKKIKNRLLYYIKEV